MRTFLKIALMFILTAALSFGQQPTFHDPLLNHFVGHWVLQGTIAGQQTTHDIAVEWVLGHQYVRIHEISREKNAHGRPAYEAMVFVGWDQPADEYVCAWLDVYGGISSSSIGHAKRSGDEIPFLFKDKDGVFHTTFTYDKKTDHWTWRMDSEQKGLTKPFARVTLTRK